MGVIDRHRGVEKTEDGEDGEKENLYTFSSRPTTPGEKGTELMVKFQAVSRTQPCIAYHYMKVSSRTKLSQVRRYIQKHFKSVFEGGFIFLCKTKEILKDSETHLTIFDILPKMPFIDYWSDEENMVIDIPSENFMYPGVQYRKVSFEIEGLQSMVTCACVVFLFERSKVSHWPPETLREELGANMLEGFCYIPTDIMSWKEKLVESRATRLHSFAAVGSREDLETAIQQLPENVYDLRDQRNAVPLHYAAENGRLDICECLIAGLGKEMIYQRDFKGKSPLHCALYRRKIEVCVYLLQLGSDLTRKDFYGNSCMDLLLNQRDVDIEFIISNLQLDCVDEDLQYQLAMYSLKKRLVDQSVRLTKLVKHREELLEGETLLHIAAKLGNKKVTQNLVSNNCDLLQRDITGFLPFHIACKRGHEEQIKLLFSETITDEDCCRGINLALRKKCYAVCEIIMSKKRSLELDEQTVCMILEIYDKELKRMINEKTGKQRTHFLFIARNFLPLLRKQVGVLDFCVFDCAYYNMIEVLKLLKSLGANLERTDFMGRTPLHESAQRNSVKVVEVLLKAKVNPNTLDWRNSSALHYACAAGHLQIVKLLMRAEGVKVDIADAKGRTPILVAAYYQRKDVIEYFLANHAAALNLYATDADGCTLLHYAVGMPEKLVDLLLEKLASTEKKPQAKSRMRKKWIHTDSENLAWDRKVVATDFSSPFADFKRDIYYLPYSKGRLKEAFDEPFKNKHPVYFWNSRLQDQTNRQFKETKPPKKKYDFCKGCGKVAGKSHKCSKQAKLKYPDGKVTEAVSVRAFRFHHIFQCESICPIFTAARAENVQLIKKLVRFDQSFKNARDELGRNLLEFCIDQGSGKLYRAVQELEIIKETPVLVHRLIMQKKKPKTDNTRKFLLEALIAKGCLVDEPIEKSNMIKHDGCVLRKELRIPCFRNCHLLGYTPLEIIVRNKDDDLIKLLLDKLPNFKHMMPLLIAAYIGNLTAIDLIHKKAMHLKKNETERVEKQNDMSLSEKDILHIACTSPNVNLELIKTICKCYPVTTESNTVNKKMSLPKERSCLFYDLSIRPLTELTVLGRLLSKDHLLYKRITQNTRSRIEDVGCFLVDSGINLGNVSVDFTNAVFVHGACEALLNAVQNGYYRVAESIVKAAGDLIWKCCFSDKPCLVQSKFKRKKIDRTEEVKRTINVNFMMYIVMSLTASKVPGSLLHSLLTSGNKNLTSNAKIDMQALTERDRQTIGEIKDPLRQFMICVCKIMTLKWKSTFDVTKLIQFYPPLICSLGYVDRQLIHHKPTTDVYQRTLQASVTLLSKGLCYCKRNRKVEEVQLPENLSLLHIFSAIDNVDNIKNLVKSGIGIRMNDKTKTDLTPIDVASACGNWNVYKYLQENGCAVTKDTLVACCATENFKDINIWAQRIRTIIDQQEQTKERQRLKIVKDICKKDSKVNATLSLIDIGEALGKALNSKLWDVAEYILHLHPQSATPSVFLKMSDREMMWVISAPGKVTADVVNNISKGVSTEHIKVLGLVLLCASQHTDSEVIDSVLKLIIESSMKSNITTNMLNATDSHGMNIFHHLCRNGFSDAVQTLSNLCHINKSEIELMDSLDKSKACPLWYALTYKHLDLARNLLLKGAKLSAIRAVPDFEPKRIKRHLSTAKQSIFVYNDKCIFDKHFGTFRKTFPHLVNTSYEVSTCIAPDVQCFFRRKKFVFDPTKSEKIDPKKYSEKRVSERQSRTLLDEDALKNQGAVKYKVHLTSAASNAGCHLIHAACSSGDLKLVDEILQIRPEIIHKQDEAGYIPFAHAVKAGNMDIVEKIKSSLNKDNAIKCLNVLIQKCFTSLDNKENRFKSLLRLVDLVCKEVNYALTNENRAKASSDIQSFSFEKFHHYWPSKMKKLSNLLEDSRLPDTETIVNQLNDIKARLSTKWIMNAVSEQNNANNHLTDQTAKNLFEMIFEYIALKDLDDTDIVTLLMLPVNWILDVILKARQSYNETSKRKVFWNFTIIDCFLVIVRPNDERLNTKMDDHAVCNSVQTYIKATDSSLSPRIGIIAMEKNLWNHLEFIANTIFENEGSLDEEWHKILSIAAEIGELRILKAVLDKLHIPRMNVQQKACFTAYLCLACVKGRTDVVKYLLRHSVPIVGALDEHPVSNILGRHHKTSWNVLHYSIQSKSETTLKAILNACKTEKDFVRSLQPNVYVKMAGETGHPAVFEMIVTFFDISQGIKATRSQLEDVYLTAARQGFENLCIYLIQEKKIDVRTCDRENRTALHYCGMLGMKRLCEVILEERKDGLLSKDIDGYTPFDYAELQGRTSMIIDIMLPNIKNKVDTEQENVSLTCRGWLTCLLQKNSKLNIKPGIVESSPHVFGNRELTLETLLMRTDDEAAAFIISAIPHIIRKSVKNKSSECKLFHLAARYNCNFSLERLCDAFSEDLQGQRLLQKQLECTDSRGLTPLHYAIKSRNMKGIEKLLDIGEYTYDGKYMKETILHTAVKSENYEIVQMIDKKSKGRLRREGDLHGLTPLCYALALGLHWIARSISDKWDERIPYKVHSHKTLEESCVDCLLDHCIGWSKIYLSKTIENVSLEESLRPISWLQSSCGLVDHYKTEVHRERYNSYNVKKIHIKIPNINFICTWCSASDDMIKAALFAMGYNHQTVTAQEVLLKSIEDKTEAVIKALKKDYRNVAIVLLASLPTNEIYKIFDFAATTGKKYIFEKYHSQLYDLECESHGSIANAAELALAFGNIDVGFYIDNILRKNGDKSNFMLFGQLGSSIPQKVLWITGVQTPGDESWLTSTQDENSRLTLPDIWMTVDFPTEMMSLHEERIDVDSIIPETCRNKKFIVDLESFRKHKSLKSKTEVWIRSFIASSQIFGYIGELLQVKDTKSTAIVAAKVICLPIGSSDHPKVYVDNNGTLQETLSITAYHDVLAVHHENTYIHRPVELALREMLLNDIIPQMEEKLHDVFGLNTKIKVDWNSVDMRKRTSGVETILKILTGEVYGNPLGGLNDALLDCEDMKATIEGYFNKETFRIAVEPVQAIRSITVSFVDNLTSHENQQPNRIVSQDHYWHFGLDRSGLIYDRTSFALWHVLNKYRAACVAFCDSVYTMSHFHPLDTACDLCSKTKWHHKIGLGNWYGIHMMEQKLFRSQRSLTLEIDWKSFNVNNEKTLMKLIGEGIAREVYAVAFECEAMLRLSFSTDHVIVRNSASVQYTGVSMQGKTGIINVYVHQTGKKQWLVDNGNTCAKLAEIEDKQLITEWPFELFSESNNLIRSTKTNIQQCFGMKIDISMDARRLIGPSVQKCRRDLTHPHKTIPSAIRKYLSLLPDVYQNVLSTIFTSPYAYHCREIQLRFDEHKIIQPGAWKMIPQQHMRGMDLNQEILVMKNIAKPKRVTEHYGWFSPTPQQRTSKGYVFHEDVNYHLRQTFRVLSSEAAIKLKNIAGSWKQIPLKTVLVNKDGSQRASDVQYISSHNRLFQIIEPNILLRLLSRVPTKVAIGYDVLDSLEIGSLERFERKLCPTLVNEIQEKHIFLSVPLLHESIVRTNNFEGIQHISQIYVDWSSFADKLSAEEDINLQLVVQCLRDTLKILFQQKTTSCSETVEIQNPANETLRKITMIRLKKISKDFKPESSFQDRVIFASEKGTPDLYLRRTYEVTIAYRCLASLKPYSEQMLEALVQLLELEVKNNILRYLDRKMNDRKKSKVKNQNEHQKSRPELTVVVRILPWLLKAIRALLSEVQTAKTELSDNFVDFQFASTKSETSFMTYENGILFFEVSPRDLCRDLSQMMLNALELPFSGKGLDIKPVMNYEGPTIRFSAKGESSVSVAVTTRYGNTISQEEVYKLYNPDNFSLKVWKDRQNAATVAITKVERGTKESCIKVFWNADDFKPNKKRNIQLLYMQKAVGDPVVSYFHGNEPLMRKTVMEEDHYKIDEGGFIIVMTSHDTKCYIAADSKSRRSQEISMGVVTFIVTARKPRRPKYDKAIPLTIEHIRTRDNIKESECFQLTCDDSLREACIYAKCTKCGYLLQIITPLKIFTPGQSLMINK